MDKENFRKALNNDPFCCTKVVNLELSNICNYTYMHPQCPTSKMKEKYVMPLTVVEKIAKRLGEAGYDKKLSPYAYSEPLIDPRMYVALDILRENVPKAMLAIISNGFFLYEPVLDEIIARGIRHITITAYLQNEHERIELRAFQII